MSAARDLVLHSNLIMVIIMDKYRLIGVILLLLRFIIDSKFKHTIARKYFFRHFKPFTLHWRNICKSKMCLIYWTISSSVSGVYDTVPHQNRTAPGSDLLPFLFMLWRRRSRQRVQERQPENTATARQVGWGRVPMRCVAGWSFQRAEGNGRWGGRRWGGRRGGGGAVLPVKPASPFPTRINVS